ncbi:MAG: hypothetical protein LBT46_03260 [Planctomycetaceae bacterium]|nr:hypothetical protein [Planctomycetaceae bacterium]
MSGGNFAGSSVPLIWTSKKSLSSWVQKVAKRAGIELWEKPMQNCRSSRATELRKTFPEFKVNSWLGHSQEVAESHYIQILDSDFLDACSVKNPAEKSAQECAQVTAEMALKRAEVYLGKIDASQNNATLCNVIYYELRTYIRSGRT